ncbi:MAG: hypothetical protein QUS14_04115 [Pyrinomonadaceae bacterium]|nr:hypothetical protein [Pyrinomonadaceae bacterium]
MIRTLLGVVAGFFAWVILWFGFETILSLIWPAFGEHQAAFQAAVENGGPFTPNTFILLLHIVLAAIVSLISGYLAAAIAGPNSRATLFLGLLLLAMGLVKASMSWPLVPIWYHIAFTAVLPVMTIVGGRLNKQQ